MPASAGMTTRKSAEFFNGLLSDDTSILVPISRDFSSALEIVTE
jgi:hypothetical protein